MFSCDCLDDRTKRGATSMVAVGSEMHLELAHGAKRRASRAIAAELDSKPTIGSWCLTWPYERLLAHLHDLQDK